MSFRIIPTLILLVATSSALAAPSHCTQGETVLFNCQTGKKTISLCATRSTMQYRFGALEKVEIVLPENGQVSAFAYERMHGQRHDLTTVSVRNGDYRYEIGSGYSAEDGQSRELASLQVYKGQKSLANLQCNLKAGVNFLDASDLEARGVREAP